MWSAFGREVELLLERRTVTLRRFPALARWRGAAPEERSASFDDFASAATAEIGLRRGDRVTVYVTDRVCELHSVPLVDGVRDEELVAFATAARARSDPAFDGTGARCVADRMAAGRACVLAALRTSDFEAVDGLVRSAGARLVSMRPWCASVISHWLASKDAADRGSRWLMLLEADVCTIVLAADGILQRIDRVPVGEGQDPAGVLDRAAVACDVDTDRADVWTRGDRHPGLTFEALGIRQGPAFLDLLGQAGRVS